MDNRITTKAEKKLWISVANVIACFCVVILHCNSSFWNYTGDYLWDVSNFIETLFYFPVPVFFMISGVTLIGYRSRYSTSVYFKNRIRRTVVPFLFWSLISVVYRYLLGWNLGSVTDIIYGVMTAKYVGIYWFFIPLFSIYLSIPLLSAVDDKYIISTFSFSSAAAFILISVLPTISALLGRLHFDNLTIYTAGGYVIYLMLGYIIDKVDFTKEKRRLFYCLAAIGWLIHFYGTAVLSDSAGEIVSTVKGYTNFPAVLYSAGVFLAIKTIPWNVILGEKIRNLVITLSKYTFGIYLIHYYFIEQGMRILNVGNDTIAWKLLAPPTVFIVCTIVCWFISKIPVVKKTIGL